MAPQSTDTAGNAITDPIVSVKCLYLAPCWSVLNTKRAGALACDISLNMFSGTLRRGTSVPHETRTKKKKKICHLGKSPTDFMIKRTGARRRWSETGGSGRLERSVRVCERIPEERGFCSVVVLTKLCLAGVAHGRFSNGTTCIFPSRWP